MRVAVFSAKDYDRESLAAANEERGHELVFFEAGLEAKTTPLAAGFPAVCLFVNDEADAEVCQALAAGGTRLLALRSAGFNHVDLPAAHAAGLTVARVPAYSPHAVAEHAAALVLALNRRIHRAYSRVRDGNFTLGGLCGFDLHGRTVGVIGTGKIGVVFARIMAGFGCRVLGADPHVNPDFEVHGSYAPLPEVLAQSDVISLHCPLTPQTRHLIGADTIAAMRPGVMLINTGRGGLVDTRAVIEGLKQGQIGYLGLDVYEEEEELFFADHSSEVIQDDVFMRLLTFPNVLITAHQGFFTREAVRNIADTTLANISAFETGKGTLERVLPPE